MRLEIFGGNPTRIVEYGKDFESLRKIFLEKTNKPSFDTVNGEAILLSNSFYLNKKPSNNEIDTILKYYNYLLSDTSCRQSLLGAFRGSVRFVLYNSSKKITIDIADVWSTAILLDESNRYVCIKLWEYLVNQVPNRYKRGMRRDVRFIKKQQGVYYKKNECCS